MITDCNGLPPDIDGDIEAYADALRRFQAGELDAADFRIWRAVRGVYEQRKDGSYMLRVRLAGGDLTIAQARALAALSREFAGAQFHVTTRQAIQLHDVRLEDTPAIMRRLRAAGLGCKGGGGNAVRNIVACPHAGTCPAEHFDATPFAHALTAYLLTLEGSYTLPRKYKIACSGCGTDCAFARASDVGFVAATRDGAAGFTVYVGGGLGSQSRPADLLEEWIPAAEAIRVAEAVRRLFDRMGDRVQRNRARLRFVLERVGIATFRDLYRQEMDLVKSENVPVCAVSATPRAPAVSGRPPIRPGSPATSGLRTVAQHQAGRVTIPLHLPLGLMAADDLDRLADVAERFSPASGLRATREQKLLLRSIKAADLPAVAVELRKLRTDAVSPNVLEHFVACAGASICRPGFCLSRAAARACADRLDAAGISPADLGGLMIHLSGCPNACGQHHLAAIGFCGGMQRHDQRMVPSYRLVLGARDEATGVRLAKPAGTVPARNMPGLLVTLLKDYAARRRETESFADYVDRHGSAHFEAMVQAHGALPAYEDRPEFYRDW